jgi:hypothetical protein|tara:strand:+ start:266 stop:736 length:471 start_codon:yes stop_codon:yes gene_type:complete
MSTRSVTMVVHRSETEKFVKGFAIEPSELADKSYVNMYMHHDGYPEYHGVELSNWINYMQNDKGFTNFGDGSRIAAHLVKDMHYNSQYLYPSVDNIDHQYTWVIWVGKEDVWLSCYDNHKETNVFVGTPDRLIKKYKESGMEYTDWNSKLNTNNNR